ncbi:hypothetical protein [Saccharopolyspora pogona]|nr:hypothetical protein [Saccharopolyspora pogona]
MSTQAPVQHRGWRPPLRAFLVAVGASTHVCPVASGLSSREDL